LFSLLAFILNTSQMGKFMMPQSRYLCGDDRVTIDAFYRTHLTSRKVVCVFQSENYCYPLSLSFITFEIFLHGAYIHDGCAYHPRFGSPLNFSQSVRNRAPTSILSAVILTQKSIVMWRAMQPCIRISK
jgi:hypothetical protein